MATANLPWPRGRGTATNPPNRFEPLSVAFEEEAFADLDGERKLPTQLLVDRTRSVIARNVAPT